MNINGHMGGKTEEKYHGEDVTTLKDNPTQPSTDGVGKHHQEKPDKTPGGINICLWLDLLIITLILFLKVLDDGRIS